MNIEVLQDYINEFKREVIDSGFKRDVDDYASSLPASQNNIVVLREIAMKVLTSLERICAGDLPENLANLLPSEQNPPFTALAHDGNLRSLMEDSQVQQAEFFTKLTQQITLLKKMIQTNIADIDKIRAFIQPYVSKEVDRVASSGVAMLSIVFCERQTITSLERFSKTLAAWNRILPIYHQLLKSASPKDVEIVEIQNGSIDCIVNVNADVALDLVELFKLGFEVFAAYLAYKKMAKPLVDSYHGNKKLLALEEEREKLLLENIGNVIEERIKTQHSEAKKKDRGIDGTSISKKIEQVTSLVASHIVKGNDIKLLALPKRDGAEGRDDDSATQIEALRNQSVAARRELRAMPAEAQHKLLAAYGTLKGDAEEKESV